MENTEVKIYHSDISELWYVYIYQNGKVVKKFYKGINKTDDPEERMKRCEYLKYALEKEIASGVKFTGKKNALPTPYQKYLTIPEAYDKAYELLLNSGKRDKTKSAYKTHHKFFKDAVIRLKWQNNMFNDLEQYHITKILEEIVRVRGKGNSLFNKQLSGCKAFFTVLKKEFIIKDNAAHGISERSHQKEEVVLLTPEEQTKIIQHFNRICPQYIVWLKTLYHIKIRPEEMRNLKCGMINTEYWYFDLPPELTKNKKKDIVLIPDDLRQDLEKMDLSKPDYYLFGILKWRSRDRSKLFHPSEMQVSKNVSNYLWRTEVKQKLGIDSNQYWVAYKGSNDKLRNGMPFDVVSRILRHSTHKITEIYATESSIIAQEQNKDKFGTFE
ncbi:site-specific integrase [Elizabethkingia anophelis]|nr:site-specific integrase [Elizabethkingia anophelis]MCT4042593.1 site-specific integrase [Elizabethkingia anophelis]